MRILVTGREGQVAQALVALNGNSAEVVAVGRPDLDITQAQSVRGIVAELKPDIVVNAAAYTAVDRAESDEALAFLVNRDGARNVATVAVEYGLPVIHISTDYVFDGLGMERYREDDPTGPQGVYGRSKLEGERAVAAANPAHAILRTAWVYGPFGQNFLKTMLRLAGDRDVVRVVGDQHGTPTYAPDIAEGILAVAHRLQARDPNAQGIFHMVADGETTWAGFAEEIFARSAERGGPSAQVEPISTREYPTPAKRPANSRLDTARFVRDIGHRLPDWRSGVVRCLDALERASAR
ncbi:dTDP-4-dehydrorhamnose reductase [Aureimonas jatrophae]|uniref:dTDP-4-dehydrorhamnose reductase n=1 Tax=Aureimonas jatrophae TaxID=1166073 RepID=A0A1H0GFC3_9HYPH|nr:dTDP-4-dehydrorhamnose reductase [Aureimonas jatrophae]MBB3949546.1 dTDP-4-dehydrorhamnose reductase [Aureimonas jatrophae]SDO05600.1 dTDP-4-dehydrorhamnose reductase [Aureimonas jatrophae]